MDIESLLPEEKDELTKMILSKMSDNSQMQAARQRQDRGDLASNLAEAGEGMFRSRSMALGGQGVDKPFYDRMRSQNERPVQDADMQRKEELKTMLFARNRKQEVDSKKEADLLRQESKAAAAENQTYERGRDAKSDAWEREKFERGLENQRSGATQNRYEIKVDPYGRTYRVDKVTGDVSEVSTDPKNRESTGSQMDDAGSQVIDTKQPPSPIPGETKQQYQARMRVWEKENSGGKSDLSRAVNIGGEEFLTRTPDDAKIIKDAASTKEGFDRKLSELIDLRQKFGVEYMDRNAVARARQLSKDLLLAYKNMQKLGVLSQSDEAIINAILPSDPLGQDFAVGQDPILNNLQKFKEDAQADFESNLKNRIYKPTGQSQQISFEKGGQPQAQQQAPQLDDEDMQAIEWAKSNPDDPRSAQILQGLGVK